MPKTWSLRTLSNLEEQINLCIFNLHFVIPLTWHFTWFLSKCPCLFSGSLFQKMSMFPWRLYGQKISQCFLKPTWKIIKGWGTLDFSLNFQFFESPEVPLSPHVPHETRGFFEVPQAALHVIFQVATSIDLKMQRVWIIVAGQGSQHGPFFAILCAKSPTEELSLF